MRVLIEATTLEKPLAGPARVTIDLYKACIELSEEIEVVWLHQHSLQCEPALGAPCIQRGDKLSRRWWRQTAIPWSVMICRPSIVHFPENGHLPRIPLRVPVVTTIHDTLGLSVPGYFDRTSSVDRERRRLQYDADRSDLIITVSDFSRREILRNVRVKREPVVIYPGCPFDWTEVAVCTPAPAGEYFLYVGSYAPYKRVDVAVRTFLHLHNNGMLRSRLLLVGGGEYASLEQKALFREASNAGAVQEMRHVSDAALVDLMRGANALLCPSSYEGFGLPPLEAMFLGCPVLTTRCASIPEVCGDAVCYIDPENTRELTEALIALETNSELRLNLRSRGVRRASLFSWRRSAEQYLELLSGLCRERQGVLKPR